MTNKLKGILNFMPNSSLFMHPFFLDFYQFEKNKPELEVALKSYFLKHPEEDLSIPKQWQDSHGINKEVLQKNYDDRKIPINKLNEDTMMEEDSDVSIFRHIRYLPAILHKHDFFEISCVFDGKCINHINSHNINMGPGDICITSPGVSHALSAFDDNCLIINILIRSSTFDTSFMSVFSEKDILADFFIHTLFSSDEYPFIIFRTGLDFEIQNTLEKILNEYYFPKRYQKKILNLYTTMFLALLLRNHENDIYMPNVSDIKSNQNTINILRYLQENYIDISLKEMAEHFNYSERQISRIIHDNTGESFSKNVKNLKLNKANQLLTNSDISISDIAIQSGFSDSRHFRLTFKKIFGINPTEYRKMKANETK